MNIFKYDKEKVKIIFLPNNSIIQLYTKGFEAGSYLSEALIS